MSLCFSYEVTSTTPTEVPGVLLVIVIFCHREYSQYCYTTFVGVLPMCTPSGCLLTVWEWSHKYYTTFVGVLLILSYLILPDIFCSLSYLIFFGIPEQVAEESGSFPKTLLSILAVLPQKR